MKRFLLSLVSVSLAIAAWSVQAQPFIPTVQEMREKERRVPAVPSPAPAPLERAAPPVAGKEPRLDSGYRQSVPRYTHSSRPAQKVVKKTVAKKACKPTRRHPCPKPLSKKR